jgi:hypothetical protein
LIELPHPGFAKAKPRLPFLAKGKGFKAVGKQLELTKTSGFKMDEV